MPTHIKYFEWLMLSSLALGLLLSILTPPNHVTYDGKIITTAFTMIVMVFTFSLILLLTLLISRKRSNIAKWVLVALFAAGLVTYIQQLAHYFEFGFAGVLSSIQLLAQCTAIYFLFTEESRNWLK